MQIEKKIDVIWGPEFLKRSAWNGAIWKFEWIPSASQAYIVAPRSHEPYWTRPMKRKRLWYLKYDCNTKKILSPLLLSLLKTRTRILRTKEFSNINVIFQEENIKLILKSICSYHKNFSKAAIIDIKASKQKETFRSLIDCCRGCTLGKSLNETMSRLLSHSVYKQWKQWSFHIKLLMLWLQLIGVDLMTLFTVGLVNFKPLREWFLFWKFLQAVWRSRALLIIERMTSHFSSIIT